MPKICYKEPKCHTTRLFPEHKNWRAHIKWLSQPRTGTITPKFLSNSACCCRDARLSRRIKRMRSASERLQVLAQPFRRNVTRKYADVEPAKQHCVCVPKTKCESSRLDQLAMPYVRFELGYVLLLLI